MASRKLFHLYWAAPIVVALGCATTPANPPLTGDFAIVDVTVIPMDTERLEAHRTVVVADGRIKAVLPADATRLAPNVRQVDGRGRYLIPGLADMHVHIWGEQEYALYVANGVTLVRNMWGNAATLERRRRIAEGKLVGPRVITPGPLADGDPPIWSSSLVVHDAAEACAKMAEQQRLGYDFFKIYNNISPSTFDGIVACSRSTGFPFAGHTPDLVGMERMIRGGASSIEHLTGYGEAELRTDRPRLPPNPATDRGARTAGRAATAERVKNGELAWSDVFDLERRDELAALAASAKVWSVPTLTVKDHLYVPRSRVAEELQRPEMRYVDPLLKASWNPDNDFRKRSTSDRDLTLLGSYFSQDLERVKALKRAGAPLMAGSDAPNPFTVHGFALHDELALLVQAGLTPYEALATATTAPARFLGEQGRSGVVAPGARADLVLLDANPLADISATRRIEGVSLDGRWLTRDELQAMLAKIEARFAIPDDWFAKTPPLPGRAATATLMKQREVGVETGAERYEFTTSSAGWKLLAQNAGRDRDDYVITVTMQADATGKLDAFDYRRERAGAVTQAQLRREGDTIVLKGSAEDGAAVDARKPQADFLTCDLAACLAPLVPTLRAMAPGARQELSVLSFETFPDLAIEPQRWTITRNADPALQSAQIDIQRGEVKRVLRVRWDDRGLVAAAAGGDMGTAEVARVDVR
ncbi:MAG: amidohydrolase family protein [Burkholderiales bacterium]